VMSRDRPDNRAKMKSNEHSRRNNSDGSKGAGSKELKKKTNMEKRKKSKSVDMTRPKYRMSVPNSRSRMDNSAIYERPKRKRFDTEHPYYTREQSP